jgi:hypothetical protein
MADKFDIIKAGPGSRYTRGIRSVSDEAAMIVNFVDGGVETAQDMVGAASAGFQAFVGNAPLRTVEVNRLGGGQALSIGRYGRSGGGSGLERRTSFGTGSGAVRWHVDSKGNHLQTSEAIVIDTTIISATVYVDKKRNPWDAATIAAVSTINKQPFTIPGMGSIAAGHVRFRGVSGDYIESPQRWFLGLSFEIQHFRAHHIRGGKFQVYGWEHTERFINSTGGVRIEKDWPEADWGKLNL